MDGLDWSTIVFSEKGKSTKVHDILAAAALQFGLTIAELKSPCHAHRLSHPRQLAMYLARDMTTASLPQIGFIFGKRHHTTVLFACRKIAKLVKAGDAPTISALDALRETASHDNPTAAYRQRQQEARYAEEERLARLEAERAVRHAEQMQALYRVKQRAQAGYVSSGRTGALA